MTQNILSIHHSSLIISDTETSLKFYSGVLNLKQLDRPPLPFPGAWFELGTQQLHILELENPDSTTGRPAHGGKDRHVAFNIVDLDLIKKTLEEAGIAYTLSRSGRRALFCRDPDGNALEFIEM